MCFSDTLAIPPRSQGRQTPLQIEEHKDYLDFRGRTPTHSQVYQQMILHLTSGTNLWYNPMIRQCGWYNNAVNNQPRWVKIGGRPSQPVPQADGVTWSDFTRHKRWEIASRYAARNLFGWMVWSGDCSIILSLPAHCVARIGNQSCGQ